MTQAHYQDNMDMLPRQLDTATNRLTWNDTSTLPRQHGYVTKTTGCNYDNTYLIPQKKLTWLTQTCYQDNVHTKTTWHAAKTYHTRGGSRWRPSI